MRHCPLPPTAWSRWSGRNFDSQFIGKICLTVELGEVRSVCMHFLLEAFARLPIATSRIEQSSTLM